MDGLCGGGRPVLELLFRVTTTYYLDVSTECTRSILGLCRGGGGNGVKGVVAVLRDAMERGRSFHYPNFQYC